MPTRDQGHEGSPDRIKGRHHRHVPPADYDRDAPSEDVTEAGSARAFSDFQEPDWPGPAGRKRRVIARYFGDLILENAALRVQEQMKARTIEPGALSMLREHIVKNRHIYRREINSIIEELANTISDTEVSERLGALLIEEAKRGDIDRAWDLLEQGADINHVETLTGFTVLHYAAAQQARWMIKLLTRYRPQKVDYLVTDRKGRLPSVLAFEVAGNNAIGTFLTRKEVQCARGRGIDYRALLTGEIVA